VDRQEVAKCTNTDIVLIKIVQGRVVI